MDKATEILELDDDHEFWRRDTPKTIVKVKKQMVGMGIDSETADELIRAVWSAATSEYGD